MFTITSDKALARIRNTIFASQAERIVLKAIKITETDTHNVNVELYGTEDVNDVMDCFT